MAGAAGAGEGVAVAAAGVHCPRLLAEPGGGIKADEGEVWALVERRVAVAGVVPFQPFPRVVNDQLTLALAVIGVISVALVALALLGEGGGQNRRGSGERVAGVCVLPPPPPPCPCPHLLLRRQGLRLRLRPPRARLRRVPLRCLRHPLHPSLLLPRRALYEQLPLLLLCLHCELGQNGVCHRLFRARVFLLGLGQRRLAVLLLRQRSVGVEAVVFVPKRGHSPHVLVLAGLQMGKEKEERPQ